MEDNFQKLCGINDLPENNGKRFLVNDTEIAVFKIDNEVFAIDNVCPHQHTALLYDGFIENGCVVCPAHGWMFDLKTGNRPTGSRGVTSYPIKIIDDNVFILVKDKELRW